MIKSNIFTLVLIITVCAVNYCMAGCGAPDLMKNGNKIAEIAKKQCANGNKPTPDDVKKIRSCADTEISKAKDGYKEFIKLALNCMKDEYWADPCNPNNVKGVKKCGEETMQANPKLKTSAMQVIGKHCHDFLNHMKTFASCTGHPI